MLAGYLEGELRLNFSIVTYIDQNRERVSSESAYLTPEVLARPNLKVAINSHVTRILFDSEKRAVGVEYANFANGPRYRSRARKEVILSWAFPICDSFRFAYDFQFRAGAIHSPHVSPRCGHSLEYLLTIILDPHAFRHWPS